MGGVAKIILSEMIEYTLWPNLWLVGCLAQWLAVVKVTLDSRGGAKFKNITLHKWIKHCAP